MLTALSSVNAKNIRILEKRRISLGGQVSSEGILRRMIGQPDYTV